jgi:hypothetical protein
MPALWKTQQGISFLSSSTVAVYQVSENSAVLAPQARDASGGGRRYLLRIVFFSADDGKELKTLLLTTSGNDRSWLYPTHDGKFLLRTGDILRVYSANFQEETKTTLPHSATAARQVSMVSVSPSGKLINVHYGASYPTQPYISGDTLLDADTLKTIVNPKPTDMALWPEGPGKSLFPNLATSGDKTGIITSQGAWQSFDYHTKDVSCYSGFHRIAAEVYGGYGCKDLRLYAQDGRLLWDVPIHDEVVNVLGTDAFIAAAVYHRPPDPMDLGLGRAPLGIKIYDLANKSEVCLIPPTSKRFSDVWPWIFFDVSQEKTVAVIQANQLSLYRP